MAFKNEQGNTIVLDAVMTDLGRQRMAAGTLEISKYAFGDDEIDYSLSYEDAGQFKVLSASNTPLLEAFENVNGDINHGLLSYNRNDICYIPILKTNEKLDESACRFMSGSNGGAYSPIGSTYYLSVNDETTDKLKTALGEAKYILEHDSYTAYKLIIESGVDATDDSGAPLLPRDKEGRDSYILQMNLLDNYLLIHADRRFIEYVIGPTPKDCVFANTPTEKAKVNFTGLTRYTPISLDLTFPHHYVYSITTIPNLMYNKVYGKDLDTSAIAGPRGSATALNFCIDKSMTTTSESDANYKYSVFGTLSKDLFDTGDKYDYIDTNVYIVGSNSQQKLVLPVRIIRYSGV
jgi:hypothetical protein